MEEDAHRSEREQSSRPTRVLTVLGMHRSGTSAVARGLECLSFECGDRLLPPAPDNPAGFWEDQEIVELNDRLLAACGGSWDSLTDLTRSAQDWQRCSDVLLRAVDVLRDRLRRHSRFGFKDPRTCRLLPFWQAVFAHLRIPVSYLIVVRNPLSVAQSLAARNGFPSEKTHLLWLQHVLPALLHTRNAAHAVVDYDLLLDEPARQFERVAAQLGLGSPDRAAVQTYVSGFLAKELRHAHWHPEDVELDPRVPALTRRLYGLARKLALDEIGLDDAAAAAEVAAIHDAYQSLTPVFRLLERSMRESEHLRAQAGGGYVSMGEMQQAVGCRDQQIEGLTGELAGTRAHADGLQNALAERDAQVAGLQGAVAERDGQLAGLHAALAERDAHLAGLQDAQAHLSAELEQRDALIGQLRQTEAQLNEEIARRDIEIEALRAPAEAVAA